MENLTKTIQENIEIIEPSVFDALLQAVECATGYTLQCVGLTASLYEYTISFYGDWEDDYALVVEDFGKMCSGKWVQCEATEEQLVAMKARLDEAVASIEKYIAHEELNAAWWRQEAIDAQLEGDTGSLYSNGFSYENGISRYG